jgi:hypothetical protein
MSRTSALAAIATVWFALGHLACPAPAGEWGTVDEEALLHRARLETGQLPLTQPGMAHEDGVSPGVADWRTCFAEGASYRYGIQCSKQGWEPQQAVPANKIEAEADLVIVARPRADDGSMVLECSFTIRTVQRWPAVPVGEFRPFMVPIRVDQAGRASVPGDGGTLAVLRAAGDEVVTAMVLQSIKAILYPLPGDTRRTSERRLEWTGQPFPMAEMLRVTATFYDSALLVSCESLDDLTLAGATMYASRTEIDPSGRRVLRGSREEALWVKGDLRIADSAHVHLVEVLPAPR